MRSVRKLIRDLKKNHPNEFNEEDECNLSALLTNNRK